MGRLRILDEETPRIVAFTGKGGVGKTTCATATAVHLARNDERVLLLSSDRSPSLSDILDEDVYGEVTSVEAVAGLDAVEMDYAAIADRWRERYGEEVYQVISSFVPVDREVIDYVAEAPGIPEEFAMSYILDFYEDDSYDRIVWDTAPAGSTVSLLQLQEQFYAHLGQAPKFYAELRAALKRDGGRRPSTLLSEWRELSADCLEMVRADDTRFVVVTIPETLGVRETDRIVDDLRSHDLNVERVVANHVVTPEICDCDFHRRRAALHGRHLETLESRYADDPGLVTVPQFADEVQGVGTLERVSEHLFEASDA
jgi:arsenite-transporting ATPase